MRKIIASLIIIMPILVNGQIIADHNAVAEFDSIPSNWIDSVKNMLVDIPGESHSSGYRNGMDLLESFDNTYESVVFDGFIPNPSETGLRIGGHGSVGEEDFYTNQTAINAMMSVLNSQSSGGDPYDVFGFGWCWDMTWVNGPGGTVDPVYDVRWAGSSVDGPYGNHRWGLDSGDSALTGNSVCMDTYLDAVDQYIQYCETNSLVTRVIFTTGPVDDMEATVGGTENGFQREIKHDYIRDYVNTSSDYILFDYADILCWNNSGEQNTEDWNDGGDIRSHAHIHPDNMMDYDGSWNTITHTEDGDHIGEVGAMRVAKAMWWLLARMAGWEGVSSDGPIGSDDNIYCDGSGSGGDGSWANPFGDPQDAINASSAGDTIWLMFDRFVVQDYDADDQAIRITSSNQGEVGNPITLQGYPGYDAILDFSQIVPDTPTPPQFEYLDCINMYESDNWTFRDLRLTKGRQLMDYVWVQGIAAADCRNLVFERIVIDSMGGRCLYMANNYAYPMQGLGDTSMIINCDFSMCVDSFFNGDTQGGGGDGMQVSFTDSSYVLIEGNRAWITADDAFNTSTNGLVVIRDNWAWDNGVFAGDGCGFKSNVNQDSADMELELICTRNIAWGNNTGNTGSGFTENNNGQPTSERRVWNNTSYGNTFGFVTLGWNIGEQKNNDYRNNIALNNELGDVDENEFSGGNFYTSLSNSWDSNSWTLTEDDFVGPLDSASLHNAAIAPRGADGSLPEFTNFNLVEGSDLIDAGNTGVSTYVTWEGDGPDIGYKEYAEIIVSSILFGVSGGGGVMRIGNTIAIIE